MQGSGGAGEHREGIKRFLESLRTFKAKRTKWLLLMCCGFAGDEDDKVGSGVKELMFQAGARLDSVFPNPFAVSALLFPLFLGLELKLEIILLPATRLTK